MESRLCYCSILLSQHNGVREHLDAVQMKAVTQLAKLECARIRMYLKCIAQVCVAAEANYCAGRPCAWKDLRGAEARPPACVLVVPQSLTCAPSCARRASSSSGRVRGCRPTTSPWRTPSSYCRSDSQRAFLTCCFDSLGLIGLLLSGTKTLLHPFHVPRLLCTIQIKTQHTRAYIHVYMYTSVHLSVFHLSVLLLSLNHC